LAGEDFFLFQHQPKNQTNQPNDQAGGLPY